MAGNPVVAPVTKKQSGLRDCGPQTFSKLLQSHRRSMTETIICRGAHDADD